MELVVFIVSAIVAVAGALAMLVSRNAVHSALFLLLNFGAIAVLYLLLQAPFLFAVQLIVYGGAIIVLFLFVIMLLGVERVEDAPDRIAWQRPLAIALGLLLLAEALYIGFSRAWGAVTPVALVEGFGSPESIGVALFTTFLLPFEITSIVLLAAIIGVVVLSKRGAHQEKASQVLEHPNGDGHGEQMEQVMEQVG